MTTQADPWLEQQSGSQPEASTETAYQCPHCGTMLTPHNDAVGSLHCYDSRCVNCCFLPPDEESQGKVRGKFEARPCPMAGTF